MKKLLLILLTLGTGTLFAQVAHNGYYGGDHVGNGYAATTTTYNSHGNYGNNTYYNGAVSHTAPACAPTRVRWETSPCGTYRWKIVESSYWVPGAYVYTNGCRRWNDGYYGWRQTCRTRVNNPNVCYSGCGHGHVASAPRGHHYGNGHGHGHGPRRR